MDCKNNTHKKRVGHFTVDSRILGAISNKLGCHAAMTYLVLACGTGRDHRTTYWSVDAVETYTTIPRRYARQLIRELAETGFIEVGGTQHRPAYRLILHGGKDCCTMDVAHGVWLPNKLVTSGTLDRARQTGDPQALRLLIDIYAVANFEDASGIPAEILHQGYKRNRIAARGKHVIWAFLDDDIVAAEHPLVEPHGEELEHRLTLLRRAGLIEIIPHLCQDGLMTLFPFADRHGTDAEKELGATMRDAAWALLENMPLQGIEGQTVGLLLPELAHMNAVTVHGIVRPRWHPDTTYYRTWFARNAAMCSEQQQKYQDIIDSQREAAPAPVRHAVST